MIEIAPKVVALACRWVVAEGATEAGGAKLVPVLCSGRVTPGFILQSFEWGASGVLVAGCGPEKCRYVFGARQQEGQFGVTREVLKVLGIPEERVKLAWVAGPEQLEKVAAEFTAKVRKLPPLPIAVRRPEPEKAPDIEDVRADGRAFACIECGKCTGFCPVSRHTKSYSPHRIVNRSFFSEVPEKELADSVWGCLTCGLCERRCPAAVKYAQLQQGLRGRARAAGETGRCTHSGALLTLMRLMAAGAPAGPAGVDPRGGAPRPGGGHGPLRRLRAVLRRVLLPHGGGHRRHAPGLAPQRAGDRAGRDAGRALLRPRPPLERGPRERRAAREEERARLRARGVKRMIFPCAECQRTWAQDWPRLAGGRTAAPGPPQRAGGGRRAPLRTAAAGSPSRTPAGSGATSASTRRRAGAMARPGVELAEMRRSGSRCLCGAGGHLVGCDGRGPGRPPGRGAGDRGGGPGHRLSQVPDSLPLRHAGKEQIRIENVAEMVVGALDGGREGQR